MTVNTFSSLVMCGSVEEEKVTTDKLALHRYYSSTFVNIYHTAKDKSPSVLSSSLPVFGVPSGLAARGQ
jgi:hypothetical protein